MRLIDADALFDFLTDQLEKETGAYRKGYNVGINIARSALHDKTITPTIVQQEPNPHLTPVSCNCIANINGECVAVQHQLPAAEDDEKDPYEEAFRYAGVMGYDPYEDDSLDCGNPFGGNTL